ncbi:MAG: hypothetical protein KatS3mg060_1632 [Dehalococcoidia bacterium]|nr:MAG: hypothetical protein KatS3mg060_1632 [Dehalococcoidia bacterium]
MSLSAEVADQPRNVVVGERRESSLDAGRVVCADNKPFPADRARQANCRLILLVAHVVDAAAQRLAAGPGEDSLQSSTVLCFDDVPVAIPKDGLELAGANPRHHSNRGSADFRSTIQMMLPRSRRCSSVTASQTLPLVQLGVAYQRDITPATWGAEMQLQVPVGERCKGRGGRRPDPTDPVEKSTGSGSFRAAGVGLQAAKAPERGEIAPLKVAEQILNGMIGGRGVLASRQLGRRPARRQSRAP